MPQPMYSGNWKTRKKQLTEHVPATIAICCCCCRSFCPTCSVKRWRNITRITADRPLSTRQRSWLEWPMIFCVGTSYFARLHLRRRRHIVHTVGTTSYCAHFGWRRRTARGIRCPWLPAVRRRIKHGNAGKLGNYPILSYLPDKFARFLYEFHAFRFESLDLPPLPTDRSDFDVHRALNDEQVRVRAEDTIAIVWL